MSSEEVLAVALIMACIGGALYGTAELRIKKLKAELRRRGWRG
jgi:hypothetical protein